MAIEYSGSYKSLKYGLAGPHYQVDGVTLAKGSITAYIPLAAITRVWPSLTTIQAAVAGLNVTRTGDAGRLFNTFFL